MCAVRSVHHDDSLLNSDRRSNRSVRVNRSVRLQRSVHSNRGYSVAAFRILAACSCALLFGLLFGSVGCVGKINGDEDGAAKDGPVAATPRDPDFSPTTPLVRRLTRDEYRYTAGDVLGIVLSDEDIRELPVDRPLEGFTRIPSGQATLPEHIRAYSLIAERIVNRPEFEAFLSAQVNCRETSAECGEAVARHVGFQLFRRPLENEELTAMTQLFDEFVQQGADFNRAARALTQVMLQSPQFLYLIEAERIEGFSGLREVNGYEMASRLSYSVWASAPDAALYEAVERGKLDTSEGIEEELTRMLADSEKTKRVSARYILDWAALENLPDDDGLRADLTAAAVAFYQDHVERDEAFFDVLTIEPTWLTPALAESYGMAAAGDPAAGSPAAPYDLSREGRLGLLGQPGVIAGMTNADGGEIVARGLFLQKQIFCGETPDPPDSLQEEIDAFAAALPDDASHREIAEQRLQRPECAACHRQFDPLGYAFEAFDFRGRHRSEDEHGNPVAVDGWLPESFADGEQLPYVNLREFVELIKNNPLARRCIVQRQFEFMVAARLASQHQASIQRVAEEVAETGTTSDLLRIIVTHDLFRILDTQ